MTTPLFKKMNLKDQKEILVLNAPSSFDAELRVLKGVKVLRSAAGLKVIDFAIAFVMKQAEVDAAARTLGKLAKGDAVVWFAYPKQSSKRYQSEIHRDHGWDVIGKEGFEPVRAVAIDEDWSGLRVRRVEFIKTMKRPKSAAMTAAGKRKAGRG
ncbi:MAG TPA: hypothetical protein VJU15_13805 [Gemmatimonadales bacterium]|nr:hypothetical protein [Gemmatimonadales bacterium]